MQRAFRFYTMKQFAKKEIDRRIGAKKVLVEEVRHQADEKLREAVVEFEGKVAGLTHELRESHEHREDLTKRNEKLELEIAALKLTVASDSDHKADHEAAKGSIQEEILELQS